MFDRIREMIKGMDVLILGFGREGKSTLAVLEKVGGYRSLAISDRAAISLAEGRTDIRLITGEDYQKCLDAFDIVFKSPGIVLERDPSGNRCRIVSQTEVFFSCYRDQIIGITGTKGKSTTTSLLYHILRCAGRDVVIAGNIGIPVFDHAQDIKEGTIVVVELSCHQLEYMTVSPHTGVLVNIHEEHLDHYGTMEKYVAAKQKIYRNQKRGDILFCREDILPEAGTCEADVYAVFPPVHTDGQAEDVPGGGAQTERQVRIIDGTIFFGSYRYRIPEQEIQLMGDHNFYDIAIVFAVCMQQGISVCQFDKGLKSYEILPHRLHCIGTRNGVKYYDDSISTICDTTIQALHTLKNADTVLIGGMDRGIDYRELIEYLSASPIPNIILMEATGKRILQEIRNEYPQFQGVERLILTENLKEAVQMAKKVTRPGHSCVLSPAAASYGIFKNFEERGDRFAEYVMME